MWERGLKLLERGQAHAASVSLPMWERGLKHDDLVVILISKCRSPCGSVD